MVDARTRSWSQTQLATRMLLVFALSGVMFTTGACAQKPAVSGEPVPQEGTTEETAQDADATSEEGSGAESVADEIRDEVQELEDEAEIDAWADECTDRHGDATAYAVAELTGADLQTLLRQQDYAWNARNLLWIKEDGSAAIAVLGPTGKPLAAEGIDELAQGAAEGAASYRITSSRYRTPKRAFDALVGRVMTCEDSDVTETSGVAVASGVSGKRCLVFVNTSQDIAVVSVFSEEALAAGLFDELAGETLGSSVDEVFEALVGRAPGAAQE